MSDNMNQENEQTFSYSANAGQVTMPAPERHQTTTYIDSVNVSHRYVNNEYAQPAPPPVVNVIPRVESASAPQPAAAPTPVQQAAPAPAPQPVAAPTPVQQTAPAFAPQPVAAQAPVQQAAPAPAPQPVATPTPVQQAAPAPAPQPAATPTPVQQVAPTPAQQAAAPQPKPVKEKKGPNAGLRILISAASGLVFGIVAAAVILLSLKIFGKNLVSPRVEPVSSEIISELPTSEIPSDISGEGGALTGDATEELGVTNVKENMTVAEVAEECMPSIVIVNTTVEYNYYGTIQEVPASGTGVIVGMNDDSLFIATNYHVIEDAKSISVQFCDDSTASAEVKGKKVSTDLAVITVSLDSLGQSTKEAVKLAKIGDSEKIVVGEQAVAIGNALGYGQSVTAGVISALDREVTTEKGETGHFIQTDAAINPGNSGGALLNMRGELIGINSNKLGGTQIEGMGYAIPINVARPIIEQLIDRKELEELPEDQQSYFGISGVTVKSGLTTQNGVPLPVGVYVRSVVQGSPADLAGILANDIITEFEGESIISVEELARCLASYPSGTEVTITYKRLENGKFVSYSTKAVLEAKKN